MKIVADQAIPFLRGVLEPFADVVYLPGAKITKEDLLDADAAIIRTRTKCTKKLLEGTKIRFIATATIGMDHMDIPACQALGIRCVNAPGCNAPSVAQYIVSILLADAEKHKLSLSGKTIGIIGAGHVGTKVAGAAGVLGMKVLLNDPPRARREGDAGFVSLDTLLKESDYITLHTPLNESMPDRTYHLADEEFFLKIGKHPFFINASRGEVTDQGALKSALITGRIRGAALDVWEDEPEINRELLSLLDFATPHIAGYSADGKAAGTMMSVRQLAEFFNIPELREFQAEIPSPLQPELEVKNLYEAVMASYDVTTDTSRLRNDPESFEKQRADYPLRREFHAFTVKKARSLSRSDIRILQALGFHCSHI